MNILQLTHYCAIGKGGVSSHVNSLTTELIRKGHNVIWATWNGSNETAVYKGVILYKHGIRPKHVFEIHNSLMLLKKILDDNNIEIVHCHVRIFGFYMQILHWFYGVKVPWVWTNHLADIPHGFIYRNLTFFGKHVIAVSSDLRQQLITNMKIAPDNISVVLNGVDVDKFVHFNQDKVLLRNKFNVFDNEYVIVLLGRMDEVKGHKEAVLAVSRILTKNPKIKLKVLFTGHGPQSYIDRITSMIHELHLDGIINLVGIVKPEEILAVADLVILPSYKEGFAITAVEAIAAKKPVIRTKTAGYTDMKESVIGIPIHDDKALAESIQKVMNWSERERNAFVENAFNDICVRCSNEYMANQIEAIYVKYKI